MRPQHIHYLRANHAERSPHRLFVWDTETQSAGDEYRTVDRLRCWAAETAQRHGRRASQPVVQAHAGRDLVVLADAIEGACRSTETTWAFAHNQTFDLGVTRLPLLLRERGWQITGHALATDSPWARLQRGGHRLVLADSASWLPYRLADIGATLDLAKLPLPADDAPDDDWAARCRADVTILRTALCQLLDWWDRHGLGAWSITGPSTGWNLMRHQPGPHSVVIDPDPDGRALERLALRGGRREVWRVGKLPWSTYLELDFRSAHATVAAHLPLPKRRSVSFERLQLDDWRLTSDRWAPLSWVTLQTAWPRYPLAVEGALFYPVGRFRTVLAGPEIAEAARRRELLSIGPGRIYHLGAHMAGWGHWVLAQLAGDDPATPGPALQAIKGWSRTVPGKWAGRTGRQVHSGPAAEQGWHLEHGIHHPSRARVSVLDMAGERQVILQDQDSDDSFPAVLAWIQSYVRVRLGRLIDAVGPQRMVSCNTDGLVYDAAEQRGSEVPEADTWPLVPRLKGRYGRLDVISPQHLVLDAKRRLSGVPASADEVSEHVYSWMTWPRLPRQIASGERAGYLRERRSADLTAVPVNRWRYSDGLCGPVAAEMGPDDSCYLLPPQASLPGSAGPQLAPRQHPVLTRLLDVPHDASDFDSWAALQP